MRFTYFWPGWAVALGIGIAIGITVFVYFRVARPMHPRYRVLLVVLRIFAAAILLGCLLAPIVIEKKDITPPTHLSVLVDTSRSMELVDIPTDEIPKSRLRQVNQLLFDVQGKFLQTLQDRFEVHLYPFDTGLHQNVPLSQSVGSEMPQFKPEGALTDIGGAIQEAASIWKGQQTAGIVLITDGGHNSGQFPLAAITVLEVPVYTVGVGVVEPPKDIQIQQIDYAPIAYTDHESIIRVNVTQTGYIGKTTRLSLREMKGNTLIDAATLTFDANPQASTELLTESTQAGPTTTKQVVELKLTPQNEGNFQYTVALPALDGELTEANNRKMFFVKVVKAKLNVFYLEGRPRWDYTFLKRALERDPDIEATCAILSRGKSKQMSADTVIEDLDGYYPQSTSASETPRFPETPAELSKYDVLILGDLAEAHLTKAQQLAIVDFVEVQGKPVIFFSSQRTLGVSGLRNTELAQLLPIDIPASGCRPQNTEFTVQLTRSGAFHPMLQMGDRQNTQRNDTEVPVGSNATVWENVPISLSRSFNGFRLKGGATVLMENGKGTPILVLQRAGLGKSLLIAAEGLWNWNFGVKTFKDSRYQTIYPQFWAQVLRWMATDTDDKKLYLSTDAATYAIGDTAKVTAYLYSETYQRQMDATVQIEVAPPEGGPFRLQIRSATENANGIASQQNTTTDIGNLYTAQFELLHKGTYRIRAIGKSGNLTLDEDQIDVYAHPQLAELEMPQLNEILLKQLAEQTGGAYFTITNARSLPENIANVQNPVFVDAERELWAHPLILITVVGLLGTEWFLRKRIGLI
ncbi:MAG: VWA domain-containing protein [Candidatus Poribacteria bacterium]|nr:VWA domain-containing protein [Candidatus Poribacteria bacterium]